MNVVELDIRRVRWQKTISLRKDVLWPGKTAKYCHVEGDEDAWHFGGYFEGELVSVASIYRYNNNARLRKFATAAMYQGKGIGTQMLKHILTEIAETDDQHFWCDARESAMGFYERFNMVPEGNRFYKSKIPYFKMSLSLK